MRRAAKPKRKRAAPPDGDRLRSPAAATARLQARKPSDRWAPNSSTAEISAIDIAYVGAVIDDRRAYRELTVQKPSSKVPRSPDS